MAFETIMCGVKGLVPSITRQMFQVNCEAVFQAWYRIKHLSRTYRIKRNFGGRQALGAVVSCEVGPLWRRKTESLMDTVMHARKCFAEISGYIEPVPIFEPLVAQ